LLIARCSDDESCAEHGNVFTDDEKESLASTAYNDNKEIHEFHKINKHTIATIRHLIFLMA